MALPETHLLRRARKTPFLKFFNRTPPGIVCPHYYILSHANGCPYSCAYCYLQLTLRYADRPVVFTNLQALRRELRGFLSGMIPAVVNCGALSDGLAFDPVTGLTREIVPMFAAQTRHVLLIVTKSTHVAHLLDMPPTPQVIVSFSLNSEAVSSRYERRAPPPEERIAAARRLRGAGWRVRVRLDPLLPLPNWRDDYARVIERINALGPEIVTLLGFFHFPEILQYVREGREIFPLASEEGVDHRRRLPHAVRAEIYRFCIERLHGPKVGLCKETLAMYRDLGLDPGAVSCNCGTL